MIEALEASTTEIYEAVVALSRSIAGRSDLESLLSGVGESVRRIVGFDYVGLTLHDTRNGRDAGSFPEQAWKRSPQASPCPSIRIRPVGYGSISSRS